jgi:hypothetical protein
VLAPLIAAWREDLARLLAGWSPERHTDLADTLNLLARGLPIDERAANLVFKPWEAGSGTKGEGSR